MKYRLNGHARLEIVEIWTYIAEHNQTAADDWLDNIIYHFDLLADMPYMGRARDELMVGYRSFPVGNYMVLYRVMDGFIEIMHILHSRRDIESFSF